MQHDHTAQGGNFHSLDMGHDAMLTMGYELNNLLLMLT